jgi:hypothetical protein
MAQCKGKTRSGNRCKLDAQPDSDFCHLHGPAEKEAGDPQEQASECGVELEDLMPLVLAGVMVAGFFVLMKTVGKFIPR